MKMEEKTIVGGLSHQSHLGSPARLFPTSNTTWKESFDKEFTGCTCKSCKPHLKRFIRQTIEAIINEAGELFENWQGDGYIDRPETLKQQLRKHWLN